MMSEERTKGLCGGGEEDRWWMIREENEGAILIEGGL